MINAPQLSLHSPVGDLTLSEDRGTIVAPDWGWVREQTPTPLLSRAKERLEAYFDTGRTDYSGLPLAPAGTEFQRRVWSAMQQIECGATESYGALARRIRSSPRAVGQACGANPIPVLIPCHRVVSATGMGLYSGGNGTETKAYLLHLEGAILSPPLP
jgi:methylated-DNA-[protein]-cysteine S-methyltransferase